MSHPAKDKTALPHDAPVLLGRLADVVGLTQLCRCLSQLELPRQWQEVEVLQHQEPQVAGLSGEVIAHEQVYDYGLALGTEQVETPG